MVCLRYVGGQTMGCGHNGNNLWFARAYDPGQNTYDPGQNTTSGSLHGPCFPARHHNQLSLSMQYAKPTP